MWGERNRRVEPPPDEGEGAGFVGGAGPRGIVPPSEPRGADDGSSDTGSLQDANEFADMETLMAELDDVAVLQGAAGAAGGR